jgi:hypothetical protein
MTISASLIDETPGSESYRPRVYSDAVSIPPEKAVPLFITAELRKRYPVSQSKRKAPGEFSLQAIADDLGVTKPQIADALGGRGGIGRKFEEQFARKFYAGSIDRLRAAAVAWAAEMPEEPTIEREPEPGARDSFEAAVDSRWWVPQPRPAPELAAQIVRDVRATRGILGADGDLGIAYWQDELRGRLPNEKAIGGSVVGDDDDLSSGKAGLPPRKRRR